MSEENEKALLDDAMNDFDTISPEHRASRQTIEKFLKYWMRQATMSENQRCVAEVSNVRTIRKQPGDQELTQEETVEFACQKIDENAAGGIMLAGSEEVADDE